MARNIKNSQDSGVIIMKTKFSTAWKSSKQPRKQRKYTHNAPSHIKSGFLGSHLSKELKKKYNKRSIRVKKGDKIKIMRGKFKGKTGKVENVDVKRSLIYVEGIQISKKDGTKTKQGFHSSNMLITELNLDDKKRVNKLGKQEKKEKKNPEKSKISGVPKTGGF